MQITHILAAVYALFFGTLVANAETCKVTGTNVCGFVIGIDAVSEKLEITIDMQYVYTYRTAFNNSNKKYGIFMPCNAAGRISCESAIFQLALLTATSPCQDNFYVGLVVGSEEESPLPLNVLGKDFWLVFGVKNGDGTIMPVNVTYPINSEQIDCNAVMAALNYQ